MNLFIAGLSCPKLLDGIKMYLHQQGHTIVNENYNAQNADDIVQLSLEAGQLISEKKVDRAIIIDDYAQVPAMIIAKFQHAVVAPVFDDYSAQLTAQHNNANVICLATKISAYDYILYLIRIFMEARFDAGRHLVRTDMLDEILKREAV